MPLSWLRFSHLLIIGILGTSAQAAPTSYRLAHPLGWMHDQPVGEQPGWGSSTWLNFEVSHSNTWNLKADYLNRETGKTLTYEADFEQSNIVLEAGAALSNSLAFALEVPFASRGGGALDDFIDQFHKFIGSERFLRHLNDGFQNSFVVQTDGVDQFQGLDKTAVGNIKLKIKNWWLKWQSQSKGACDCGLGASVQVKFPVADARSGWSTGAIDTSLLFHAGAPLFRHSGVWATAAFSYFGENPVFSDWPRRKWAQMYELSLDLALGQSWGFIGQARLESPLMNKGSLALQYPSADPKEQVAFRVASGWNSLVYWRGSQSLGFRWRSSKGSQINFLIIEDWAVGDQDSRKDHLYVNNAPDVGFLTQLHIRF